MSTKLNENQLLAAAMLATGTKAVTVAAELSVTEETVSRWRQLPHFRAATNRLQAETMQSISCRLRDMGVVALQTVEQILIDEATPPRERLAAAFKILDYLGAGVVQNIGPTSIEGIAIDDKATEMLAEMGRSLLDG